MTSATTIAEKLLAAKRVAIMGHKQGDVDCYGSAFALSMILTAHGIESEVISTEKYPDNLDFLLNYFAGSVIAQTSQPIDTFVILDTSDIARTVNPELATSYLRSASQSILLDHHTVGDLARMVTYPLHEENVSSTSELVYEVARELGTAIDKNIASLLLSGIIADTSGFQNQNTTGRSLTIASELLKAGARQKAIVSRIFGNPEVDSLKLWGLAMNRLNLNKKYGAASTYLTYDDITSCGISGDAVTGIVNYLNQIAGAKIVMLVTEEERGQIKVSLRTRDDEVDVAALARQLGGGGHVKAAGLTFGGNLVSTNHSARVS